MYNFVRKLSMIVLIQKTFHWKKKIQIEPGAYMDIAEDGGGGGSPPFLRQNIFDVVRKNHDFPQNPPPPPSLIFFWLEPCNSLVQILGWWSNSDTFFSLKIVPIYSSWSISSTPCWPILWLFCSWRSLFFCWGERSLWGWIFKSE